MKRLDGQSLDNIHARIEELKSMFPEAVSEGRLDYDLFMALLGDEFDNDNEKYQFTWKGKLQSLRLAQKRSSGTLRPDFEESRDFDTTGNLYIEGDNLEVLKLLQQGYLRKVKMIYIDPPYNTGNDFVYEDDFKDPVARYKEVTGQGMRANPETAGRYHSNWLNMMYPRLKIAKTLLRDDGVIFISIDDNEQANLKKLCDEVFGEENFLANVIWEKKYTRSNDARWFSDNHDFILVYMRNKANTRLNLLTRSEDQLSAYANPDNHPKGVWKATPLHAKSGSSDATYTFKNGITWQPPAGTYRRFSDATMREMDEGNEFWFGSDGTAMPSRKSFLVDVKSGVTPVTIWPCDEVGHNHEANNELAVTVSRGLFDNPKPTKLVRRMLELSTSFDSNDIILDFFSGSGTTAHAVMQLNVEDGGNRKYICAQIPEPTDPQSEAFKAGYKTIAEIGKERIRRAGDKIKAEAGMLTEHLDTGFRVFKLDTSNLIGWDDSYVPQDQLDMLFTRMEQHLNTVKHDRRKIDVVYEIFLKYGIPLTEKLSTLEIEGKTFYVVGENGYLFICLDENLTVETVEQTTQYAPGTMIFCEECFADNSELTNVGLVLKKARIELRWI